MPGDPYQLHPTLPGAAGCRRAVNQAGDCRGASSGSVYEGAHLALSRCVCSNSAGKARLLTRSQTPPSSTCRRAVAPRRLLSAHLLPQASRAVPSGAVLPSEAAGTKRLCLLLFSFEAELPWHLQTQDCLLKNREEEKYGD